MADRGFGVRKGTAEEPVSAGIEPMGEPTAEILVNTAALAYSVLHSFRHYGRRPELSGWSSR